MMRYFKGNVRFDTDRRVLIEYDSSKPYPHCNTYTHINEVRIDRIRHLEMADILYLLSCVDPDYKSPDPFARENPKTRAREMYTALWFEMVFWWGIDRDEHKMKIEEWMYKYQPNQFYIFFKSKHNFCCAF